MNDVIIRLDEMLTPSQGAWAIVPEKVAGFEDALRGMGRDPALLETILYLTGVCHRLATDERSPETAALIMASIGRVRADLPLLDQAEAMLHNLQEQDQRGAEALGFSEALSRRAPHANEAPAPGSVKVSSVQPPRRLR